MFPDLELAVEEGTSSAFLNNNNIYSFCCIPFLPLPLFHLFVLSIPWIHIPLYVLFPSYLFALPIILYLYPLSFFPSFLPLIPSYHTSLSLLPFLPSTSLSLLSLFPSHSSLSLLPLLHLLHSLLSSGEPQLATAFFNMVRGWVVELRSLVHTTQEVNKASMNQVW